eukprot:10727746-Ditylum_brightwellii.AAC.1
MQKNHDVPNGQGFQSHKEGVLPVVALLEDCNEDKPFIVNIEQCLDMVKNSNIATWLKILTQHHHQGLASPHMLLHACTPLHLFRTPLWSSQAPLQMEVLLVTRVGAQFWT